MPDFDDLHASARASNSGQIDLILSGGSHLG